MSENQPLPENFKGLIDKYKFYIDAIDALYRLKTRNEEEVNDVYKIVKTNLIDSNIYTPKDIIKIINNVIQYRFGYLKSYLILGKKFDENYTIKQDLLAIHEEQSIHRAIIYDDIKSFISFTEMNGFNKNQMIKNTFNSPSTDDGYSLLELCCYHGAVNCFKFLRTKFDSKITFLCLQFSFLGGNPDIMSECLKSQKPNFGSMTYALISHNIDFVTFLINEYKLKIILNPCVQNHNLQSFLVHLELTKDINNCLLFSPILNIPSLCEDLLSLGADVNFKDRYGFTALHNAVKNNRKEKIELLISRGADINVKNGFYASLLHLAARENYKEAAEVLLDHNADINALDSHKYTPVHIAKINNSKEVLELLISRGAEPTTK